MSNRGNYNRQRYNRSRNFGSKNNQGYHRKGRRSSYSLPKGTVVYILDKLKHGGIDRERHGWNPICQVIRESTFELYEIEYKKGADFKLQDKIEIIGKEEDILNKISRRLKYSDLTATAVEMLEPVLIKIIQENEKKYIEWINKAGPITIRRHYLELLPGVGKKLMNKILEERGKKEFESINDLHERVQGFTPTKSIAQRILKELEDKEVKHHIFIKKVQLHRENRDNKKNRPYNSNQRYSKGKTYSKRRY